MKHRHGWLLSAVLLLVAGCGAGAVTSQTSMMRGPTPSSGMTIPRLLTASGAPKSSGPSSSAEDGTAAGVEPSDAGDPGDSVPAESGSPESTDPVAPTAAQNSTDSVLADEPLPGEGVPTTDPATGTVDLSTVASAFNCTNYLEQPPMPLTTSYGECTLDGKQVQLYAFASDENSDAFLDQLAAQGVAVDQLVQGPKYLVSADPSQLDAIAAALSAG